MLLVVDNGSVYTQDLIKHLEKTNTNFHSSSHIIDISTLSQFDSFILSGRRHNDKTMNHINTAIIRHAISDKKPLLGICYGAEILALALGGTIKKMSSPHKGIQKIFINYENPLFSDEMSVFESHNYEIAKIPNSIKTLGHSSVCKHELIQYETHNIFGTQFHPEMTEHGKKLIDNFCHL